MYAGFEYGPFIDPVLLDLLLKAGTLGVVIVILVVVLRMSMTARTNFKRLKADESAELHAVELKRQIALHNAEVGACKEEIGRLKREATERTEEFTALNGKYSDLLQKVEELESQLGKFPVVGKISINAALQRTPSPPEISHVRREPTLPPTNPKSLSTGRWPALEDAKTIKIDVIPREDKD